MSLERDYSNSFQECEYLITIIQGIIALNFNNVQHIKDNIKLTVPSSTDLEYIILNLDEINKTVCSLLGKKLEELKTLSQEKSRDINDWDD